METKEDREKPINHSILKKIKTSVRRIVVLAALSLAGNMKKLDKPIINFMKKFSKGNK